MSSRRREAKPGRRALAAPPPGDGPGVTVTTLEVSPREARDRWRRVFQILTAATAERERRERREGGAP